MATSSQEDDAGSIGQAIAVRAACPDSVPRACSRRLPSRLLRRVVCFKVIARATITTDNSLLARSLAPKSPSLTSWPPGHRVQAGIVDDPTLARSRAPGRSVLPCRAVTGCITASTCSRKRLVHVVLNVACGRAWSSPTSILSYTAILPKRIGAGALRAQSSRYGGYPSGLCNTTGHRSSCVLQVSTTAYPPLVPPRLPAFTFRTTRAYNRPGAHSKHSPQLRARTQRNSCESADVKPRQYLASELVESRKKLRVIPERTSDPSSAYVGVAVCKADRYG
ncbi:hypothetical protein AURDEDRAFT_116904 [Auricularia subglabra TFB-10046 SS5]|uniref:Uncharacterized protein n=1 Tax=Auricularia subglabra (strain TFB-10046 / SS5) TaxID=717982 RepID=J0WU51_AURST|nr:hypothetical protein AURDEDRAFT_116904 [Auricularia subglabra TFB-10046 SS5]